MAIQNRRGNYADFDTSKMVPGEFAVVQGGDVNTSDGKALYIAFDAGSVKRLATADEMHAYDEDARAAAEDAAEALANVTALEGQAAASMAASAASAASAATQAETATTQAAAAAASASEAQGYLASVQENAEAAGASAEAAMDSAQGAAQGASSASMHATQAGQSAADASSSARAAQAAAETFEGEVDRIDSALARLETDTAKALSEIEKIERETGLKRFGVSGYGSAPADLTRIWDSVGMTAQVGTDGDNSNVVNDFDDVAPFNRRKCVGKWHKENGHAVFHVHAYADEEGFAEDGSMGDFVAVECPRAYYYLRGGIAGVSAHQYPEWKPFEIFCRGGDPEDTVPYVYLPAYALAIDANGHAVSLPGLDNLQGDYKTLMDATRTYDGDAADLAALQPAEVEFYESMLYMIEFAIQPPTKIMGGVLKLRHSGDDKVVFTDATHAITNNYYAGRVVGEYVAIANVDVNSASQYSTHKITEIVRCDSDGTPNTSGTCQRLTLEETGNAHPEYDTSTQYTLAARPYRTGSCNSVSTPSGSPVSNSDGFHPMKYRHRENIFGNQNDTFSNLFNMRVGTGNDDYSLEWYLLKSPKDYNPAKNPGVSDLAGDEFEKLDLITTHEDYASGYIKEKVHSMDHPDIWIPGAVKGASLTTYHGLYATLVLPYVVRLVRFGGHLSVGAPLFFAAYAPSSGPSNFGGHLYFGQ